jgi:two-component system response regulator MtrA
VVLDRMLPDMDGIQVCQQARKFTQVPIIILSALTTQTDKVAGLNVGADDYLEKPFQPGELAARLRAQLRRARASQSPHERGMAAVGNLRMDPSSFTLMIGDDMVALTRLEFELLYTLARAGGQTVPREKLLETVWGKDRSIDPDGLNVYIRRLRRKIEANPERPRRLMTVRTIGYRLRPETNGSP